MNFVKKIKNQTVTRKLKTVYQTTSFCCSEPLICSLIRTHVVELNHFEAVKLRSIMLQTG